MEKKLKKFFFLQTKKQKKNKKKKMNSFPQSIKMDSMDTPLHSDPLKNLEDDEDNKKNSKKTMRSNLIEIIFGLDKRALSFFRMFVSILIMFDLFFRVPDINAHYSVIHFQN